MKLIYLFVLAAAVAAVVLGELLEPQCPSYSSGLREKIKESYDLLGATVVASSCYNKLTPPEAEYNQYLELLKELEIVWKDTEREIVLMLRNKFPKKIPYCPKKYFE